MIQNVTNSFQLMDIYIIILEDTINILPRTWYCPSERHYCDSTIFKNFFYPLTNVHYE